MNTPTFAVSDQVHLTVEVLPDGNKTAAQALIERLPFPKAGNNQAKTADDTLAALAIQFDSDGVALTDGTMLLRHDFHEMLPRIKPGKLQRELLVRAAKIKQSHNSNVPVVIDATAGLGEDSFLLAAAGFQVYLIEHDPIIAALLTDALQRAKTNPETASVVQRMQLIEGDSVAILNATNDTLPAPYVIYLDPMFPERTKSAAVKKKFQILHHLQRPCENAETLLQAALANKPQKTVIKRPLKGPFLADVKPSYSLKGKMVRYDCIVHA